MQNDTSRMDSTLENSKGKDPYEEYSIDNEEQTFQ